VDLRTHLAGHAHLQRKHLIGRDLRIREDSFLFGLRPPLAQHGEAPGDGAA